MPPIGHGPCAAAIVLASRLRVGGSFEHLVVVELLLEVLAVGEEVEELEGRLVAAR